MKRPPFPTKEDLVKGWTVMSSSPHGSELYEESFWSFMLLDDLVYDYPLNALEVIKDILSINPESDSIMGNLAAGPLEDLLVRHGEHIIEHIETEAKSNSRFASMLGGVWQSDMTDDIWQRVTKVWDRRGWDGNPSV
jgi:hypothetical protein